MGYELSNHVLDNAPDDLSPAERLVLSVLAGYVQDEATRECFPGLPKLVRRTGLKPDSLRRVFQRLAARGLDPRVPIGIDKKGRKVFAHESVKTTYRIPLFECRDESPATEEGSESRHSPRGGTTGSQWRDEKASEGGRASRPKDFESGEEDLSPGASDSDPPEPPAPSERETEAAPGKATAAQRAVRSSGVVSAAEEQAFIDWAVAKFDIKGPGWWKACAGDLPEHVETWRASRAMRQTGPQPRVTVHDTAGRDRECRNCDRPIKPDTPEGLCRECREASSQSAS